MSSYALTSVAKADIFEIWSYIAADSEEAADKVERAIYEACAFLAEGPMRGHPRRELTSLPVRFWTLPRYPNYTVVYRAADRPIEIVAVLHGKRNVRKVLRERTP